VDIDIESKTSASAFTIRRGRLRYVRLAESSVVSRRFDLGLQTLNECINGLASQRELWHIPFNESPLTQLLEPALGGNAATVFLACVDPGQPSFHTTLHAVQLADKMGKIKTRAVVNHNTVMVAVREVRSTSTYCCAH
jgi:hypothetical protein